MRRSTGAGVTEPVPRGVRVTCSSARHRRPDQRCTNRRPVADVQLRRAGAPAPPGIASVARGVRSPRSPAHAAQAPGSIGSSSTSSGFARDRPVIAASIRTVQVPLISLSSKHPPTAPLAGSLMTLLRMGRRHTLVVTPKGEAPP